ncbi:hypothetical protein BDV33DRAFT_195297 [Aspergillus novoparasiticus]|uniref:Heterokaryon incompatibility domain-containing protein n=1 Tax=Aspergillus novoparasiticus TaxID=986946 RepID=A0A5N6EET4_9EURO|nr:hypothetical protein BDV33DRAFT_195297 [Aspergillus novoparasiticus]
MLCTICRQIFTGSRCPDISLHHIILHQLEQAASEKCFICHVLWNAVSDQPACWLAKNLPEVSIKPVSQYYFRRESAPEDTLLELNFTVNKSGIDDRGLGRSVTFFLQSMSAGSQTAGRTYSITASGHYTWGKSMSTAVTWLSNCLCTHTRCQSSSLSGYIPTRLLQIGQPSTDKIRLVLHPNKETCIQYATVSHCWGGSEPTRLSVLTSTSRKDLESGIFVSELNQVFQDAIFTARTMGIHFDSTVDWQQEAPLMSDVYGGATLNIAASAAAGHDITCFPERDAWSIQPCIIGTTWHNCENGVYNLYHGDFRDAAFKGLPLMKRGWVIQELLLAPRLLHLSGSQLFWDCYELSACETYPDGLLPNIREQWMTRAVLWDVWRSSRSSTERRDPIKQLWKAIVEDYTAAHLTIATDRLIALAGIAKNMARSLGDKYIAGLWETSFITDLFWLGTSDRRGLRPRPSPYRAPSWSWASLDGKVSLSLALDGQIQHLKPLIDIVTCEIETVTDDPFGFVTKNLLRLSGPLAMMQLAPKPNGEWLVFFDGTWWDDEVRLCVALDCTPSTHKLHCLPLFLDNHQTTTWTVSCLLLEPSGNSSGQFMRVGALHAFSGALGMQAWIQFEGKKNESWFEYEDKCKDGRYTISIV